jgi:Ca2+/Na+ antiporter
MTNASLDPKEQEYWKQVRWDAPIKAIEKTEDTAKQLITLTSLLQGIFFAAISFSDIKNQVSGLERGLFILPFLFWLPSLFFAIRAFRPLRRTIRTKPAETKEDYKAIRDSKDKQVRRAFRWLGASLVVLSGIIAWYLLVVPAPSPCPPPCPSPCP